MSLSSDERALLSGRRARILEAMDEGVMLLPAATELVRSADTHFPFRQDSDFSYVTGFPEPDAIAVLAVGTANPFALFVRPRDPDQAVWVGPRAGVEGAVADYDANVAHPLQELEKELPAWLVKTNQVFLPFARDDGPTGSAPARDAAPPCCATRARSCTSFA
jgi:Xaa-Pro aminopeptidase